MSGSFAGAMNRCLNSQESGVLKPEGILVLRIGLYVEFREIGAAF
jgi:hypothetical protein